MLSSSFQVVLFSNGNRRATIKTRERNPAKETLHCFATSSKFSGNCQLIILANLRIRSLGVISLHHEDPMLSDSPIMRLVTVLDYLDGPINQPSPEGLKAWLVSCTDRLFTGAETAFGEGWIEISQSLRDSSRLIESCTDSDELDRARLFMRDGHDILRRMAGSIISGEQHELASGQWKVFYDNALDSLRDAGIPLAPQPELGSIEEFENEVLAAEAEESLRDVAERGLVPLAQVEKLLGIR